MPRAVNHVLPQPLFQEPVFGESRITTDPTGFVETHPSDKALYQEVANLAQCILVIIGATPEGKKELLGFVDGARESAHDWRALLLDLKRRGLSMAPKVAVDRLRLIDVNQYF